MRDAGRVDHRSGLAAKLKVAKAVADENIEKALYQRAKGYSYRAEKVVVESLGNNERQPGACC